MELAQSLKKEEGLPKLERLIPHIWEKYHYVIDVRHESWFTKDVYDFLKRHRICLAWFQQDAMQTPPEITSDFSISCSSGIRSPTKRILAKKTG